MTCYAFLRLQRLKQKFQVCLSKVTVASPTHQGFRCRNYRNFELLIQQLVQAVVRIRLRSWLADCCQRLGYRKAVVRRRKFVRHRRQRKSDTPQNTVGLVDPQVCYKCHSYRLRTTIALLSEWADPAKYWCRTSQSRSCIHSQRHSRLT